MKEEILEAKRKLYSLLLKVNNDILTDNEVGLMMSLSKDEQIQSLFKNKMEKEQPSTIFLIEKGLFDPVKNKYNHVYTFFGYKSTEQEAKNFCELHGYWTEDDYWSIKYINGGKLWKYRYTEIKYCI